VTPEPEAILVRDGPRTWRLEIVAGRITFRAPWWSRVFHPWRRVRSYSSEEVVIRQWVPLPWLPIPRQLRDFVFAVRTPGHSRDLTEFTAAQGRRVNLRLASSLNAAGFTVLNDDA
jgi:hypothetical protein